MDTVSPAVGPWAGNITQIDSDLGSTQYGYDKFSRLTEATPDNNLKSLGLPQEQYGHDPGGNRTASVHQPGAWSYNADSSCSTPAPHRLAAQRLRTPA